MFLEAQKPTPSRIALPCLARPSISCPSICRGSFNWICFEGWLILVLEHTLSYLSQLRTFHVPLKQLIGQNVQKRAKTVLFFKVCILLTWTTSCIQAWLQSGFAFLLIHCGALSGVDALKLFMLRGEHGLPVSVRTAPGNTTASLIQNQFLSLLSAIRKWKSRNITKFRRPWWLPWGTDIQTDSLEVQRPSMPQPSGSFSLFFCFLPLANNIFSCKWIMHRKHTSKLASYAIPNLFSCRKILWLWSLYGWYLFKVLVRK